MLIHFMTQLVSPQLVDRLREMIIIHHITVKTKSKLLYKISAFHQTDKVTVSIYQKRSRISLNAWIKTEALTRKSAA